MLFDYLYGILTGILVNAVLFGPITAAVIWFIRSLLKFRRTPKENAAYRARKVSLIVSAIVAAFFLLIFIGFFILLYVALGNM